MNEEIEVRSVQTNSNAIVSLTLGILSILTPFIGGILGIIGIVFSRKAIKEIATTNEGGKGLASSGMICSIVGVVLEIFTIIGLLSFLLLVSSG
ncbi:DUF4190 domain-containing protein [Ornithinibacillus halophilus]|uniref:DUF4190 domain-containing protein n=1 Tax=Ornithinibacillus halophilus TaxID=930117 RepID=A0A1M5HPX0_9BACI|nr:DUF4190 domain-containing protein [Ornithinibacillus halophilus]SHG17967.1 protein of unknown function [Ornithinibacillus halophilus]